jgi:hypothetical protein
LLLADLPSPSSRAEVRTDLDEIDYARWIEQKRDWFRQQFPWIFELQEVLAAACPGETLAQAGQMTAELPDYPEILLQIADIGKIACHDGRYYRIPGVADPNALRSMLASKGIDTNENLLGRAFAVQRSPVAAIEDKPTGPDILDGWLTAVKEVATCCRVDKAEVEMLCDYSATACEYLGNTRTLAWLSIKNEKWQVESDERDVALDLLRKIVQKAHDCNEASWRLNIACAASSPEEYTELIRKSIVEVDVLCELESQRTLLGKTLKLQTEE